MADSDPYIDFQGHVRPSLHLLLHLAGVRDPMCGHTRLNGIDAQGKMCGICASLLQAYTAAELECSSVSSAYSARMREYANVSAAKAAARIQRFDRARVHGESAGPESAEGAMWIAASFLAENRGGNALDLLTRAVSLDTGSVLSGGLNRVIALVQEELQAESAGKQWVSRQQENTFDISVARQRPDDIAAYASKVERPPAARVLRALTKLMQFDAKLWHSYCCVLAPPLLKYGDNTSGYRVLYDMTNALGEMARTAVHAERADVLLTYVISLLEGGWDMAQYDPQQETQSIRLCVEFQANGMPRPRIKVAQPPASCLPSAWVIEEVLRHALENCGSYAQQFNDRHTLHASVCYLGYLFSERRCGTHSQNIEESLQRLELSTNYLMSQHKTIFGKSHIEKVVEATSADSSDCTESESSMISETNSSGSPSSLSSARSQSHLSFGGNLRATLQVRLSSWQPSSGKSMWSGRDFEVVQYFYSLWQKRCAARRKRTSAKDTVKAAGREATSVGSRRQSQIRRRSAMEKTSLSSQRTSTHLRFNKKRPSAVSSSHDHSHNDATNMLAQTRLDENVDPDTADVCTAWGHIQAKIGELYLLRTFGDLQRNVAIARQRLEAVIDFIDEGQISMSETRLRSNVIQNYAHCLACTLNRDALEHCISMYLRALGMLMSGAQRGSLQHSLTLAHIGVAYARRLEGDRLENVDTALSYLKMADASAPLFEGMQHANALLLLKGQMQLEKGLNLEAATTFEQAQDRLHFCRASALSMTVMSSTFALSQMGSALLGYGVALSRAAADPACDFHEKLELLRKAADALNEGRKYSHTVDGALALCDVSFALIQLDLKLSPSDQLVMLTTCKSALLTHIEPHETQGEPLRRELRTECLLRLSVTLRLLATGDAALAALCQLQNSRAKFVRSKAVMRSERQQELELEHQHSVMLQEAVECAHEALALVDARIHPEIEASALLAAGEAQIEKMALDDAHQLLLQGIRSCTRSMRICCASGLFHALRHSPLVLHSSISDRLVDVCMLLSYKHSGLQESSRALGDFHAAAEAGARVEALRREALGHAEAVNSAWVRHTVLSAARVPNPQSREPSAQERWGAAWIRLGVLHRRVLLKEAEGSLSEVDANELLSAERAEAQALSRCDAEFQSLRGDQFDTWEEALAAVPAGAALIHLYAGSSINPVCSCFIVSKVGPDDVHTVSSPQCALAPPQKASPDDSARRRQAMSNTRDNFVRSCRDFVNGCRQFRALSNCREEARGEELTAILQLMATVMLSVSTVVRELGNYGPSQMIWCPAGEARGVPLHLFRFTASSSDGGAIEESFWRVQDFCKHIPVSPGALLVGVSSRRARFNPIAATEGLRLLCLGGSALSTRLPQVVAPGTSMRVLEESEMLPDNVMQALFGGPVEVVVIQGRMAADDTGIELYEGPCSREWGATAGRLRPSDLAGRTLNSVRLCVLLVDAATSGCSRMVASLMAAGARTVITASFNLCAPALTLLCTRLCVHLSKGDTETLCQAPLKLAQEVSHWLNLCAVFDGPSGAAAELHILGDRGAGCERWLGERLHTVQGVTEGPKNEELWVVCFGDLTGALMCVGGAVEDLSTQFTASHVRGSLDTVHQSEAERLVHPSTKWVVTVATEAGGDSDYTEQLVWQLYASTGGSDATGLPQQAWGKVVSWADLEEFQESLFGTGLFPLTALPARRAPNPAAAIRRFLLSCLSASEAVAVATLSWMGA